MVNRIKSRPRARLWDEAARRRRAEQKATGPRRVLGQRGTAPASGAWARHRYGRRGRQAGDRGMRAGGKGGPRPPAMSRPWRADGRPAVGRACGGDGAASWADAGRHAGRRAASRRRRPRGPPRGGSPRMAAGEIRANPVAGLGAAEARTRNGPPPAGSRAAPRATGRRSRTRTAPIIAKADGGSAEAAGADLLGCGEHARAADSSIFATVWPGRPPTPAVQAQRRRPEGTDRHRNWPNDSGPSPRGRHFVVGDQRWRSATTPEIRFSLDRRTTSWLR